MNKKGLLIIIISLLLLGVFFEIIIRFSWVMPERGYPNGMYQYDENLGFSLVPGFKGYFPNTKTPIAINNNGLRDIEHDYYHRKNITRILFLGGSIPFGSEIESGSSFPQMTGKGLSREGFSIEVINAGIGGYLASQEEDYYYLELYKYNPDIVIMSIVLDDLEKPDINKIKENFENYNDPGIASIDKSRIETAMKKVCHSCVFLYSLTLKEQKKESRINKYQQWYDEDLTNDFFSIITRLNNNITASGGKLIILLFPYTWQFNNSENTGFYPQEKIISFSNKNNISFVNLAESFDNEKFKDYYLKNNEIHPNILGNEKIGEILTRKIIG